MDFLFDGTYSFTLPINNVNLKDSNLTILSSKKLKFQTKNKSNPVLGLNYFPNIIVKKFIFFLLVFFFE